MTVKLKTSAKHRFGQTNVLPAAGETKFDESGYAEVEVASTDDLAWLLQSIPDLSEVDENGDPIKPQTDTNELGKSGDEDNDIGGGKDAGDDILTGLNMPDLKELAKDFPAEEWEKLNKPELKKYLKAKLA